MSQNTPNRPAGPAVSFGSYVNPETVHNHVEPDPIALPFITARRQGHEPPRRVLNGRAIDPTILAIGVIAMLTFLLGVMFTLHFARTDGTAVALAPAMPDAQEAVAVAEAEPVEEPVVANPQALATLVSASLEQDVTRNAPTDLITPTGAMSQASALELSMTEILLGLAPQRASVEGGANDRQDILSRDKLQALRDGVLAGNFTVKTVKRHGKERLCLRVPKNNITQDEAADLLREAAERGEIELPDALNTADGTFDADTLIFNLVQTSLANDGTEEGRRAAEEMSRRAFAASTAKSKKIKGQRTYLVEPGDSLAYISLQFYGKPRAYMKIFEANRELLSSPDKIQIGQRLIIPS